MYKQCCGAATFLGGSGSGVSESTPAPVKLSRLRLQAKKAAPSSSGNIFLFELLKSGLLMQVFFQSHLLL